MRNQFKIIYIQTQENQILLPLLFNNKVIFQPCLIFNKLFIYVVTIISNVYNYTSILNIWNNINDPPPTHKQCVGVHNVFLNIRLTIINFLMTNNGRIAHVYADSSIV